MWSPLLLHASLDLLDWLGTVAFAISGAVVGVRKRFDLFGVLFLAFVVAVAGGMMRDVLIGATPPAALQESHYLAIALLSGLAAFFWSRPIAHHRRILLLVDAAGLALFTVVGTQKAIEHGIAPLMSPLMGMLTGIGGGMLRDVLSGETPVVLRADLYALAALGAGAIVAIGHLAGMPPVWPALLGAGLCLFLRVMAIYRGWRVPLAGAEVDG